MLTIAINKNVTMPNITSFMVSPFDKNTPTPLRC